jgi:isoquinoline 1-oxidoreductase beta subunit
MKFASVAMSPVLGGILKKVDDRAARTMKGVVAVLKLDDGGGEHFWIAKQGLEALDLALPD